MAVVSTLLEILDVLRHKVKRRGCGHRVSTLLEILVAEVFGRPPTAKEFVSTLFEILAPKLQTC